MKDKMKQKKRLCIILGNVALFPTGDPAPSSKNSFLFVDLISLGLHFHLS